MPGEDLRDPIGAFEFTGASDPAARRDRISRIAAAPALLRSAVAGLSDSQLDTSYRPGGWTVRQVVHHVPDSHINGYTRFKLALTEGNPAIKPYQEALWAELSDGRVGPVAPSLDLLEMLHRRWLLVLEALVADDWSRGYVHPHQRRQITLDEGLALYAWHGEHHAAHITSLRRRMGWA